MDNRLIIFCRYPILGKTKTRLIPGLGAYGAADLHRRLTEATFVKAKEFTTEYSIEMEVAFEGGTKAQMKRWLGPVPMLSSQEPGDLGHRMNSTFKEAFRQGCKKVVLIGTDVPDASREILREAFLALDNNEMVLGPACDGGYWLIGLTRPVDIFSGIQWGGNAVLESTLALAKRIGLRSALLSPLNDIDTIDDVNRWLPLEGRGHPYLSVVIPALDEEENIGKTIARARDENAEIIVVDGGSKDATIARAVDSGAKVISGPRSRALQQNIGAEAGKGKVLLFLHADTILPEGYMTRIFEALMDRDVAVGAFRFATDLDAPMMKMIELLVNMRSKCLGILKREGILEERLYYKDARQCLYGVKTPQHEELLSNFACGMV